MGWETRGGREYYYRKERAGASVRSVYVHGTLAPLAAMNVAQAREEAAIARALIRQDGERDGAAVEACRGLRAEVRRLLLAAGFHEHKRQWRRPRMAKTLKPAESRDEVDLLAEAF